MYFSSSPFSHDYVYVLPDFYPQYSQPANICQFITLPLSHHFTKVYLYFFLMNQFLQTPYFLLLFPVEFADFVWF